MAVTPIATVQWIAVQARSCGEMSEKLSWSSAGSALQVKGLAGMDESPQLEPVRLQTPARRRTFRLEKRGIINSFLHQLVQTDLNQ